MPAIAIVLGLGLGWYLGHRTADFILMVLYHYKYRAEDAYAGLYDIMDDEYGHKLYSSHDKRTKDYLKYLHLHQAARPEAYKIFRGYYDEVTKYIVSRLVFFIMIPSILFWRNSLFYAVAAITMLLLHIGHKLFIKHNRVDFYARLMMNGVLKKFSANEKFKL